MPFPLQLLVYGVCCAVLLTWAAPDIRLFWRVTLTLVTLTGSFAVLEWHLTWLVAAWAVPSTSCVLGIDSRMLLLAVLVEAGTVLLLTRFRCGAVCRVGLGGIVGTLVLWSGLGLYLPA